MHLNLLPTDLVYFSLPHLNASHGIIVPVSSAAGELIQFTEDNYSEYYWHLLMILSGIVSIPKTAAYGTSKHALHGNINVMDVHGPWYIWAYT